MLSFCRISGDLAPSTRKSLAIAIVRFWSAKVQRRRDDNKNKICAFEGVGLGGREEHRPKMLVFFVGNATTIKF